MRPLGSQRAKSLARRAACTNGARMQKSRRQVLKGALALSAAAAVSRSGFGGAEGPVLTRTIPPQINPCPLLDLARP